MQNCSNSVDLRKDNTERSPYVIRERATTIPQGSTAKRREMGRTQKGYDMVSSIGKPIAVYVCCKKCDETKDISEFYPRMYYGYAIFVIDTYITGIKLANYVEDIWKI